MSRVALAADERAALLARQEAGDDSMICTYDEGCRLGCMADPADGTVLLGGFGGSTALLSPDEARREAQALLVAADHAEFGNGEWRGGEWHRETLR